MSRRDLRTPIPEPTPIDTASLADHDRIGKLESAINEERRTRHAFQLRTDDALDEIADNIKWAVKLVMGAVIMAILAGVIVRQIPSTSASADRTERRYTPSHSEPPSASSSSSSDHPDGH